MSNLTQVIGTNVKKFRQKLGLKQQILADKVEITQAALSYIEQGERNPSISTLELLAKALDVPAPWLLSKRLKVLLVEPKSPIKGAVYAAAIPWLNGNKRY